MQRVLVTGASGFIGGHLVEALRNSDIETRCLVRPTSSTSHLTELGATLVEGDVAEATGLDEAVTGVDVVFHLAGVITTVNGLEMQKVNADGPGLLAAACARRESPPTVILLSSVAAAGPTERDRVRVESELPAPISEYGRTKRAGELAAAKWADRIPTTVIRPAIVFGPRDRLTLPIFKSVATWGVHAIVGLGKSKIALLYVQDLVDLLLKAAASGERVPASDCEELTSGKGVYFAAHDTAPSYREFGSLLARAMRRRVVPLPVPTPAAWSAAVANELLSHVTGRSAAFTIDKIREAVQASWAISNEKARRQLEWKPDAPLEERLQDTVAWYEDHKWIRIRRLFPSKQLQAKQEA